MTAPYLVAQQEAALRKTYEVPWTISGKTEVVASSPTEANLKFNQKSVEQLAPEGELESFDPELKAE